MKVGIAYRKVIKRWAIILVENAETDQTVDERAYRVEKG